MQVAHESFTRTEVAEFRGDLITHDDGLTDTQHAQTYKHLTLRTVSRKLGLSHDVEWERQDLSGNRKGTTDVHLLVVESPNGQRNPLPGRPLHTYSVQFTGRQRTAQARSPSHAVTYEQRSRRIPGSDSVSPQQTDGRGARERPGVSHVMRITLGMCACSATPGLVRRSSANLVLISAACELRHLRCCRAAD